MKKNKKIINFLFPKNHFYIRINLTGYSPEKAVTPSESFGQQEDDDYYRAFPFTKFTIRDENLEKV